MRCSCRLLQAAGRLQCFATLPTSFLPGPSSLLPLCCLLLQVFQLNMAKAWGAVVTTLVSVSASMYLISVSPWYLLPFAWFIAGTAFTGVRGSSADQQQ